MGNGRGRMDFPDGSRYEGEYERDVKNGEGTFTWADGRVYRGQWNEGKQDGTGCTIDVKGIMSRGVWCKGQRLDSSASQHRQNPQVSSKRTTPCSGISLEADGDDISLGGSATSPSRDGHHSQSLLSNCRAISPQ